MEVEIDVGDVEATLEIKAAADRRGLGCRRSGESPNGDLMLRLTGRPSALKRILKQFGYEDGLETYEVKP